MMFKRKMKTDAFSDLISAGTVITGTVEFKGLMRVEGAIIGSEIIGRSVDVKQPDQFVVEDGGIIRVDELTAHNLVISGVVNAQKIWVEGTLRITSTGKVSAATLYYRNLEIEDGALLHNCVLKHLDHASEGEQT